MYDEVTRQHEDNGASCTDLLVVLLGKIVWDSELIKLSMKNNT